MYRALTSDFTPDPPPLRRPTPPQLDPRRVGRGDGGSGVGARVGAVRRGLGHLRLDAGRRAASHPGQAIDDS